MQEKATIYEDLVLKKTNVMDDYSNVNLGKYINYLKEENTEIVGKKVTAIEDGENDYTKIVTIDNKYVYSIEQKGNDIVINEIGYVNELEPIIKSFQIVDETTNKISVKVVTKLAKECKIYIAEVGTNYGEENKKQVQLENYNDQIINHEFENLHQGTNYKIKVVIKNDEGQKEQEITKTLGSVPDLTTANVTVDLSKNGWTNQDVIATATVNDSVNMTGFTLQTSKDNNTWENKASQIFSSNGTIYVRLIDSIGQEGASTSKAIENIDKTNPIISDVKIENISSTGYDVIVTASDNSQIDRIQFPTWSENNGKDDIQSNWETNIAASGTKQEDGSWKYRVNRSEHNSEQGTYKTDIYVYDVAENFIAVSRTIVTNYHVHTGSTSEGGGCYTTPVYHAHTGSASAVGGCYKSETYTYTYTCPNTNKMFDYNRTGASGVKQCPICGGSTRVVTRSGVDNGGDKSDSYCKGSNNGTRTGTRIVLGCNKTTSTVESYAQSCGKTAGTSVDSYTVLEQ